MQRITRRYRKQEKKTPIRYIVPVNTFRETDIVSIEEIDIQEVPSDVVILDSIEVLPDKVNKNEKLSKPKTVKKPKKVNSEDNNEEQNIENHE